MAGRDDSARNKVIVQVGALGVLAFAIFLDSQPNVEIPFLVYCLIGGVLLGVSDLRALLSGISFNGNHDKKD